MSTDFTPHTERERVQFVVKSHLQYLNLLILCTLISGSEMEVFLFGTKNFLPLKHYLRSMFP